MKTQCRAVVILALAVLCTAANAQSVNLSTSEKEYVLQQARDLQYSLRNVGLEELRCEVRPDWAGFFRQLGADATSPQSIVPLLDRVHFNVSMDKQGNVSVSHTGVPSPNAGVAAAMRGALQGMDEMIAGFFKTWAMYTINTPLPAFHSSYEVLPIEEGYVVSHHQGTTAVETKIDSEFAIISTTYRSADFAIEMRPGWQAGSYGYLLMSYDGMTQVEKGEPSHEQLQVSYRSEEGFQVPASVRETLVTAKGDVQVSFEIGEYEMKRRGSRQAGAEMRASSGICGTAAR